MPLGALIPLGLAAMSFFSGKKKPAPAVNRSTSTSSGTTTSTPTTAPEFQGLQNMILPMISKRLSNTSALPAGYAESGMHNINEIFDAAGQSIENDVTSRGLGTSPIASSAMAHHNRGRATELAKFSNTLPMLERQFANEDMDIASRILNMGMGQSTSSTSNSSGTGQAQGEGGGVMGGLDNMASMLGWLMGSGAFKGTGANKMPTIGPIRGNFFG